MKLILGSQSSGRKQILEQAGYIFDIVTADIDEKMIRSDNFEKLPLLLARAKANAILKKITEPAVLITSDQIVVCNGELREKPTSPDQARYYLQSYNTHPAQTVTAVVVTNTQTKKQSEGVDTARVFFKHISTPVIESLIEEGIIMNTAGGFMIEHPILKHYIDHIEGTKDSITGLPLNLTKKLIARVSE